jgi:2-keto-4-pentenoate hydratase/2-oxohepta-3-ene-1,7-dioic acid hydratase in catechol pathway
MKLVRVGEPGMEVPAVMDEGGHARDISSLVSDINGVTLTDGTLDRIRSANLLRLPIVEGRLGAPIARPSMVLCIGLNYEDHARETAAKIPTEPILFQKATNTVVGPFDDIEIPRGSTKTDWEVELGVVVGSEALYLADEQAGWDAIAGYAVSHDVSEREFQMEKGGQWTKGKSCPTFNPLGPWLVTRDEMTNPMKLGLVTAVNEEVLQNGNTRTMIFNPGYVVWYVSQFMRLEPGDLINTGTPPGVGLGLDPPRYLKEGDVVELTIEGLGTQRQRCIYA